MNKIINKTILKMKKKQSSYYRIVKSIFFSAFGTNTSRLQYSVIRWSSY